MLPNGDQNKKLVALASIRKNIDAIQDYLSEDEKEAAKKNRPSADLKAVGVEDLPASVTAMFSDVHQKLGRALFVEHAKGNMPWDGRYMMVWAKAARAIDLEDGGRVAVAGNATVFADLVEAIWNDAPRAILLAFLATVLIVLVAFRSWQNRLLTIFTLLVGVLWMGSLMFGLGIKLNFLNLIAFPITFGNGVDYAVNVMRRFEGERDSGIGLNESVKRAVQGSGGAVILCSLTTIIGYLTLYASSNQALNSFGAAMAISEITCLAAAVVTLPAILLFLGNKRNSVAG